MDTAPGNIVSSPVQAAPFPALLDDGYVWHMSLRIKFQLAVIFALCIGGWLAYDWTVKQFNTYTPTARLQACIDRGWNE